MIPQLVETKSIKYEVFEDKVTRGSWRVEAIDHRGEGEVYVVIFSGPKSREMAEEYYVWKSQQVNSGKNNEIR